LKEPGRHPLGCRVMEKRADWGTDYPDDDKLKTAAK
jgi:hypothetical protein